VTLLAEQIGAMKTLSAHRYSRTELLANSDPWHEFPADTPLFDTLFYTTSVINTPSRVTSDLARLRERLIGIASRPVRREARAALEAIRLRDEARRREYLDTPDRTPPEQEP